MNCMEFEKLILLQDSGELADRQRDALAGHLAGCGDCQRKQSDLALMRNAMRLSSVSAPSPAVMETIRVAAHRHTMRNPRKLSPPWRGILAAAASVALCFASLRLLTPRHSGETMAANSAATEIVSLVALVMGNDTSLENYTGESEMAVLADQLLILQGMKMDARESPLDDLTSLEDSQPTTLRWNSRIGSRPEKCG